jgi:hypothetical protein
MFFIHLNWNSQIFNWLARWRSWLIDLLIMIMGVVIMIKYEKVLDVINEWNPIEIHPLLYDEYSKELIHNFIIDKQLACNEQELGQ